MFVSPVGQDIFRELRKTAPGSIVAELAELDQAIKDSIKREKRLREIYATHSVDRDLLEVSDVFIESSEFLRREILRGESLLRTMKFVVSTGVSLSPLSVPVKVCEVLYGRELCLGAPMTIEKRIEAACSLALKNIPMWKKTKDILLETADTPGERIVVTKIESAVRGGICESLVDNIIGPADG